MKLATTPEEQRQWMQQWREAAIYMDEVKRDELANMTDEDGWRAIESIQSVGNGWRNPAAVCGLIEQQALFVKLRK
ncbi:MAG TPA: hypothetical protein VK731_08685 [Candidatus Cybelea sp.]|jgi:hypothetical protein|nr:hypothetical protein [Candidatus Cybelea sp.]